MAVMSNVVVISGMAALVGWALALVLGVFWLDHTRREQGAPSTRIIGRTGRAPQSHVTRRSADAPIPDLRIYAVLRAARKAHTLPDLPRPHVVAWLLAQAGDTGRLTDTWDCEPGLMHSHTRVALPAPTFYAPRVMQSGWQYGSADRQAARSVQSHQTDSIAAADADVLSFSARPLRPPHGGIAREVQRGGDLQ